MTSITDPAIELADTCSRFLASTSKRGDEFLAGLFGISAWSTDFVRIILTIMERTEQIENLIERTDIDATMLTSAKVHLAEVRRAFSREMIGAAWNTNPSGMTLLREHIPPIRMLSGVVRPQAGYPKLDTGQTAEILAAASLLLDWLRQHQLEEHDAIRAALIEGLEQFVFRVTRLEWFGWGYTFESLRSVIGAYLALERGVMASDDQPMAAATLAKAGAF